MPPSNYLIGETICNLTIIGTKHREVGKHGRIIKFIICKCACGNKTETTITKIRSGHTQSCGCLKTYSLYKHGKVGSREYSSWSSAKSRCLNINDKRYNSYGGRGISFDESWLDFSNFYKDMGNRPPHTSIDRIDNNKGYSKENCKWSTIKEQQNNLRSNVFIEYNSVKKKLQEWSKELNIASGTLSTRIRRGWSIDKAINTPVWR